MNFEQEPKGQDQPKGPTHLPIAVEITKDVPQPLPVKEDLDDPGTDMSWQSPDNQPRR
jgi:hypothetical protein